VRLPAAIFSGGLLRPIFLAALAGGTLWVYWPAQNFSFVNYDDDEYVYDNANVQSGLTAKSVRWAFTSTDAANWHPLTWLSLMLDRDLFGNDPGGFHLTNVCLHIANALLLFLVLATATGAQWRSALVSFLFALHPLHVESVAWISERKDVLSTFFLLLSLWTYVAYARTLRWSQYVRTLVYFAAGLMAKPMVVTLPLLLLVLDYWPLGRLRSGSQCGEHRESGTTPRCSWKKLILEKVPFAALSIVVCWIAFLAQKHSGAVAGTPLDMRIIGAGISYMHYLLLTVWPVKLAFFYPLAPEISVPLAAISFLVLAGITFAAIRLLRRTPWFITGWLWYLISLLPVIGIVRIGSQALADRYSYTPLIGIFTVAVWGVSSVVRNPPFARTLSALGAGVILVTCSLLARRQVESWRDSTALFRHALAVTKGNYVAHNNLGGVFFRQGMPDSALFHFSEALAIFPNYPAALYNSGLVLKTAGKPEKALPFLLKAVCADANHASAQECLGETYESLGRTSQSVECYRKAIACRPDFFAAWYRLSLVNLGYGSVNSAILCLNRALAVRPYSWEAHYSLGVAYLRKGDSDRALFEMAQATRLNPLSANLSLAVAEELLRGGRASASLPFFSRAIRLLPDSAGNYVSRGSAFSATGRLDSAIADSRRALKRKPDFVAAFRLLSAVYQKLDMRDSARYYRQGSLRNDSRNHPTSGLPHIEVEPAGPYQAIIK
jgi:tetratricopeptide (TPR) repeat protein